MIQYSLRVLIELFVHLDFLRARDIVSRGPGTEFTAAKDEDLLTVKIEGGQNTASGSTAGPSTSRPRKRGPPEVIVISDGEGSDSDDLLEGLTPEERIEFARLQVSLKLKGQFEVLDLDFRNLSSHRLRRAMQGEKGNKRLGLLL